MNKSIVITGGLGLVGSELLRRLAFWGPKVDIILLARKKGQRSPQERFNVIFQDLFKDHPEIQLLRSKVHILEVNLSADRLGLDPSRYRELTQSISEIYHLAAEVRFDLSLEEARHSNVKSTLNLIKLAKDSNSTHSFIHFHYLSTFATAGHRGQKRALEEPPDLHRSFRNTYEQTKAESEILLLAEKDSIPCTIYRASIIGGDSQTGWTSKFDTFYLVIRLFLSGFASTLEKLHIPRESRIDAVTLDFVADSLFTLSKNLDQRPSGTIFHLTAGENAPLLTDLLQAGIGHLTKTLKKYNQPVPKFPEIIEVDSLSEEKGTQIFSAGASGEKEFFEIVKRLLPYAFDSWIYDTKNTAHALARLKIENKPVLQHFSKLMDYCIKSQWGEFPSERPSLTLPLYWPKPQEPIAIIGLGALFPKCNNVPEFWKWMNTNETNLSEKKLEIGGTESKWLGGWINENLDDLLNTRMQFRIPPVTLKMMDRIQKLVLLAAQEAIEDAGLTNNSENNENRDRTGMVVGSRECRVEQDSLLGIRPAWNLLRIKLAEELSQTQLTTENQKIILEGLEQTLTATIPHINEDTLTGSLPNVAVGRVMNQFDLKGPSYVVNSGKSSPISAIEQACDILRVGEADLMIAGGVHALSDELSWEYYSKENLQNQNNSLVNEGVALFVLKRLSDAIRDSDRIYSIIQDEIDADPLESNLAQFMKNALMHHHRLLCPLPATRCDEQRSIKEGPLPIAIIRMACILPGSDHPLGFWKTLINQESQIHPLPNSLFDGHPEAFFHPDPDEPDKTYNRLGALANLPKPLEEDSRDPSHQRFIAAFHQSIQDSPIDFRNLRTSIIVGESKSSQFIFWENTLTLTIKKIETFLRNLSHIKNIELSSLEINSILENLSLQANQQALKPITNMTRSNTLLPSTLTHLAKALKIGGGQKTIDAACGSSLAAIHCAVRELRLKKQDCIITGGAGASLTAANLIPFAKCRALASIGSFPFDEMSDGIVLGEGSVVFILKRLEDAQRDGDQIHGVILGIGASSDGKGQSMMAPSSSGQKLAMERALENAKCSPHSVGWIECHATGTRVGDASELDALTAAYRTQSCPHPIQIGSVKSIIGHTLGAAGAAGLLKVCLGLRHRIIPGTLLSTRPHPDYQLEFRNLNLNQKPESWKTKADQPKRAAVSAFGFGGTNWHIILEESPTVHAGAFQAKERQAETLQIKNHQSKELQASTEKIAFLFPGHGSPFPNMGWELYCHSTLFRYTFREANEALRPLLGLNFKIEKLIYTQLGPSIAEIENTLLQPDQVQPILMTINIAYYRLIKDLGLLPDILLGHSVGELSAAVAAGMISFEDGLRLSYGRGKALKHAQDLGQDTGQMLAVFAPWKDVERFIDILMDQGIFIELAIINCHSQTVLSGSSKDIQTLIPLAQERGWMTSVLPISVAWHSSIARQIAQEGFKKALTQTQFQAPFTEFLSNVKENYFSIGLTDKSDLERLISKLWTDQLGSRFDFPSCVESLYSKGIRTFIEVGPKATLSRFVKEILDEKSHQPCEIISTHTPKGTHLGNAMEALKTKVTKIKKVNQVNIQPTSLQKTEDLIAHSNLNLTQNQATELLLRIIEEKTGYESSQLNLDAELEGDLGIDTIKQAQILGHFRKFYPFPISVSTSFRIKDYPTLRHWIKMIQSQEINEPLLETFSVQRLKTTYQPFIQDNFSSSIPPFHYLIISATSKPNLGLQDLLLKAGAKSVSFRDNSPTQVEAILFLKALVTDSDSGEDHEAILDGLSVGLELLTLCQTYREHLKLLCTFTGSISGPSREIDGLISGFTRTVSLEWPQIRTQLFHLQRKEFLNDPIHYFKRIVSELRRETWTREIILPEIPQELFHAATLTFFPETVQAPLDLSQTPTYTPKPKSVWVIAGGTGGLGLCLAQEILTWNGASVILVGRSKETEVLDRVQLQKIKRNSPNIYYKTCDIVCHDSMKALEIWILSTFGKLTGIIHAAGILADKSLETKTKESFTEVYQVKVEGAKNLISLAGKLNVEVFCAFTSIAGKYGNPGQSDYSAANAAVASLVTDFRVSHPEIRSFSIAWGAWDQVGMGARSEILELLKASGRGAIDPSNGIEFFRNELFFGGDQAEVILESQARNQEFKLEESQTLPPQSFVDRFSFLDRVFAFSKGNTLLAEYTFTLEKDSWLRDHQLLSIPALPATLSLEILSQAARVLLNDSGNLSNQFKILKILNFKIHSAVSLQSNKPSILRIRSQVFATINRTTRQVHCQLELYQSTRWAVASEAKIECTIEVDSLISKHSLREQDSQNTLDVDQIYTSKNPIIPLGPFFHVLKDVSLISNNRALGSIQPRLWSDWKTKIPDISFQFIILEASFHLASLIAAHSGALQLTISQATLIPTSCDSIQVSSIDLSDISLNAGEIRIDAIGLGNQEFNIIAFKTNGDLILEVKKLKMIDLNILSFTSNQHQGVPIDSTT